MGVAGLFAKFVKTHSPTSVLTSKPASKTRGLCFDLNGTLHPIAAEVFMYRDGCKTEDQLAQKRIKRQSKSYDELEYEFLEKLNKKMYEIIAYFDPYEFIIIAVDGVPPVAKVDQQRIRRIKPFLASSETAVSIEDKEKNTPLAGFDITFISPGTPFMEKIHNYILVFLKNNISKFKANSVVYTSYKEPGEGEHKIFKRLREPISLEEGNFYDPVNKDNVILWGLDGDLIIIGLVSPTSSIYMCRENLNEFVNIDSLKIDIKMNPYDFCVISNLLGNDFLPKNTIYFTHVQDEVFAAYNKVKKVFEEKNNCCLTYYKEERAPGVSPDININYLFSFFRELSKYESDLATGAYFHQQKNKGRLYKTSSILERAFNKETNKIDMNKYDEIVIEDLMAIHFSDGSKPEGLDRSEGSKSEGSKSEGSKSEGSKSEGSKSEGSKSEGSRSKGKDIVFKDTLKNAVAYSYVNAMLWMYSYYTKGGDSVNWNYRYPFLIAPSLTFIIKTIGTAENFISNRPKNIFKDEEETPYDANGRSALSMGELLLIITPPKNLKKMFEKKYEYTDLSEKYFFNFDMSKIKLYEDSKERDHMIDVVLPPIDVKVLKKNLLEEYALKIKKYETENEEKIRHTRINDFEKKGNLASVNERVLKSKLADRIEYKYRTPLYEDGDYVYFQRIKKPEFVIPRELSSSDFTEEKDALIISVKDLSRKDHITRNEIREIHKETMKQAEMKKKMAAPNPFIKSFLEQFKVEGIKSGF